MDYKPEYVRGTVYVEPKVDDWGSMFRWVENEVKAFTHTGTPLELPIQCKQVAEVLPKGFFFHTGLTHPKGWQHIKSAIAYDPDSLRVNIFDMVSEEFFVTGVDLRGYKQRKDAIRSDKGKCIFKGNFRSREQGRYYSNDYMNLVIIEGIKCKPEEVQSFTQVFIKAGYEGSVIKRPNSLYNLGKTTDWLRMKPVPSQDCEIVGFNENSIQVLDEKGVKCNVPFPVGIILGLGKIIEVAYSRLTEAGRMREPRFVRVREDKTDE